MKRLGTAILILALAALAVCATADEGFVEVMLVKVKADIEVKIIDRALINYYMNLTRPDPLDLPDQTKSSIDKSLIDGFMDPFLKAIEPKDVELVVKDVVLPCKDTSLLKKDAPDISKFIVKGIKGYETIELSSKIHESGTKLVYAEKQSLQAVPEPASLFALISGVGAFTLFRKRRG